MVNQLLLISTGIADRWVEDCKAEILKNNKHSFKTVDDSDKFFNKFINASPKTVNRNSSRF